MSEPGLTLPVRRRRRPALSCVSCRQRKIRCNRELPCSHCIRTIDGHCVYDTPPGQQGRQSPPRQEKRPVKIAPSSWTSAAAESGSPTANGYQSKSTPASSASSHEELDLMRRQITLLEEQLCRLRGGTAAPVSIPLFTVPDEAVEPGTEPRFGFHDSEVFGCAGFSSRSMMHKKRLFGQSHWVNTASIFRDIFDAFEQPHQGMAEVLMHVRRCKELGRAIKSRLEPPWPTLPKADLPPRDLADRLVANYIGTMESILRIVHIPTLRREYEAAMEATTATETTETQPDMSQIVMLKLVMAIGAASYDRDFSLRDLATGYVHEAIAWLSQPEYKARLGIRYIQTAMLLLLARQLVGVGWSMTWISMGELLRSAIFAGLHRDPSRLPRLGFFASEMRRRVWNSLLEMELQASLDTGAMPFLAMHHFDTQPPGNYDDEQLEEEGANGPVEKPDEEWTTMSIARALRKTFAVRLAIAKFLNEIGTSPTYKDTLHLDSQLRAVYKPVSHNVQRQWKTHVSHFQRCHVDCIMRRSLLALHVPFFGPSLRDTAFAYTRKVAVDSSLTLWRTYFSPSPEYIQTLGVATSTTTVEQSDFSLLMAYRLGGSRGVAVQAVNILLAELRAQVQEDDALDVTSAGSSYNCRTIIQEAKDWSLQSIRVGETNVKGYLFIAMIGAQIEGIARGADRDELNASVVDAVIETRNACAPIMEQRLAALVRKDGSSASTPPSLYQPMDDWDTALLTHEFDLGIMNPENWMFDDNMMDAMAT